MKIIIVVFGAVLLFGTIILGDYDWWPQGLKNPVVMKSGIVAGLLILLAVYLTIVTMEALKARTNVIITQNKRFIYNPHDGTHPAGPWNIKRLGGINAPDWMISTSGSEGALIYPADAAHHLANNMLVSAKVERVPFSQLTLEIRTALLDNYIRPPYWVATMPVALEARGVDYLEQWRLVQLAAKDEYHTSNISKRTMDASDAANRHLAVTVEDVKKSVFQKAKEAIIPPRADRETAYEEEDRQV